MKANTENCPHCGFDTDTTGVPEGRCTVTCGNCNRVIPLCTRCEEAHPDENERPCDNCPACDLANFMNYLRGFVTAERFLETLNPSLTDLTTGLPEGVAPTLDDYVNDTYGESVDWDVKYWDAYRLVTDSFLNAESSEDDCRAVVEKILELNNG